MEQKRKLVPPVYLFAALVLMWLLNFYWPVLRLIETPWSYLGIVPILLGIGIAAVSASRFAKAETGIVPFDEATTLVTGGLYRYTRNPMYLGMFIMLLGVAIMMGSVTVLLPFFIFMLIIRYNFVAGEERFLEDTFGQPYLDYKAKVRRWI